MWGFFFIFFEILASARFMVFHSLEDQAWVAGALAPTATGCFFFPQPIRPSTVACTFITLPALSQCHHRMYFHHVTGAFTLPSQRHLFFYLTITVFFHYLHSPLLQLLDREMPPKKLIPPGTSQSPLAPAPSKSIRQRMLTNKQQQLRMFSFTHCLSWLIFGYN
jgi:hypothetical protein